MLGIESTARCTIEACTVTVNGSSHLGAILFIALLAYFTFVMAYCITELIMEITHGSEHLDDHIMFFPLTILLGWPYRIIRAALQIRCMSLKWQPQNLKL